MEMTADTALKEIALLKPRQSLQNVGEKKDDDDKDREDPGFQAFGPDGFTFLDFLDIINPLQHIPIVATLYRDLTGDQIDPGSRIAGGTLFGGPIGAIAATVNVALTETTGQDMGDHIMAFLNGEGEGDEAADPDIGIVQLANGPAPSGPAAEGATLAALSPITANLEVLQWARRESALMAAAVPAETRWQTVELKKLPAGRADPMDATEPTDPTDPYDIATNSEVLDWARYEARLARSPGQLFGPREQAQIGDQQRPSVADIARQDKVASGLTQAQLMGAAAPSGGWFSETMLLALASYQDSAGLARPVRLADGPGATDQNMSE